MGKPWEKYARVQTGKPWEKYQAIPQEQPGILERAGKNLPQDISNIGQGVIDTISHPVNAASNLGAVMRGGMQSALSDRKVQYLIDKGITPEARPQFKAFVDPLINTVAHPLESFANAPASTFLNATGLLSAGSNLTKAALGNAALTEAVLNEVALGKAALGKAATKVAEKTAAMATEDAANVALKNALMAPKKAVLEAGQKAGFVIPKSEVAGSFINNRLESIAGKSALGQESILRNQQATSAQARKALGVDVPISGTVIKDAIKAQYKPYEDVAALPVMPSLAHGYSINSKVQTTSKELLAELKQARHDSQAWYRTAAVQGGNPEMIARAKALSDRAKAIETEFENRAVAAGKPELVAQMRDSRTKIAQVYSVDAARNVATGEIDPTIIGAQLDKAPDKIIDELKQIGEFQQAFSKYVKAGENTQTPGVSKIEAVTSIGGGLGGAAMGGPIGGFVGAMLPFVSNPVRDMLLSKWYQSKILRDMEQKPSKFKEFMNTATNRDMEQSISKIKEFMNTPAYRDIEQNLSKFKEFTNTAANRDIDKTAMLGLVASDKRKELGKALRNTQSTNNHK